MRHFNEIKELAKRYPNDSELGKEIRKFINELDLSLLKRRLSIVEGEIVMHNYNDGWSLKGYREEKIRIESQIKNLEG